MLKSHARPSQGTATTHGQACSSVPSATMLWPSPQRQGNVSTMSAPPTPTGIEAPLGATSTTFRWSDGSSHRLPNSILRGYCPCAACQGHLATIVFQPGCDAEIKDLQQVGNYALRFVWGDRHSSGIYSFEFLLRLGKLYDEHGDALPERLPQLQ